MESDIILTKISVPVLRLNRVIRKRLVLRGETLPHRALLVLSAPAGYGKSTLMAEWAMRAPGAVAWVTLGPSDNDLVRFWQYVTVALSQAVPAVTRTTFKRMAIMRRPPFETPLHPLISELAAHRGQVGLFLDDFHCISDPVIQSSVATLLKMAPPNLRVFIASRSNPTDVIGRLDEAVTVEQLRTRTVAFTRNESSEFFDGALQSPLPAQVKEQLLSRTDGWAAGLQIAAFGAREAVNPAAFARQFSGQHRHLLEFFREEVLSGILPGLREFVVKTSILDRFNADLCNAVLERRGSEAVLSDLAGSDIFVVPLDDEGKWYRYQSLFRDVARQHLESEFAAEAPQLHDRAAAWLEHNGLIEEAVAHAISAKNWDRVVDLVEPTANRLVFGNRLGSLRSWVPELPPDVLLRAPYLSVWLALATLAGDLRADIEKHLVRPAEIARERGDEVLRCATETIRLLKLNYSGETGEASRRAHQELAQWPPDEKRYRAIVHRVLGVGSVVRGRPLEAQGWYASSAELSLAAGNPYAASVAMALGADTVGLTGLVDEGLTRMTAAIAYAEENLDFPVIQIPIAHARLLYESWEVQRAIEALESFDDLCNETGYMIFSATGHFYLAQFYWAKGEPDAVDYHLEMARRQTISFGSIEGMFASESRIARMRVAEGNWDSADMWERSERADPTARASYATKSILERIRLWRAINSKDRSCAEYHLSQLRELGRQAREDSRGADLVDCWVAQATGEYHLGSVDAALSSLSSALALAEAGSVLRPFLEEGARIQPLLQEAQRRGLFPAFLGRLESVGSLRGTVAASSAPSSVLTERETEILRLLAMGYQNHEIADRVVLSENTVKTHLKNVYAKLGIKNRTQAVARGRELRLVP